MLLTCCSNDSDVTAQTMTQRLYITIDGQTLPVVLVDLTEEIGGIQLRIIGKAHDKDAVVSFVVDGIHPLDMGTLLDMLGVAVRTGHHCAQPLLERLGLTSTVRASFALYNTMDEVEALAAAIRRVIPMLS